MRQTIRQHLLEMIENRLNDCLELLPEVNGAYARLKEQRNQLLDIIENITEEEKDIEISGGERRAVQEYFNLILEMGGIENRFTYLKGFEDCFVAIGQMRSLTANLDV